MVVVDIKAVVVTVVEKDVVDVDASVVETVVVVQPVEPAPEIETKTKPTLSQTRKQT